MFTEKMDLFSVETAELASVLWTVSIKSFGCRELNLVLLYLVLGRSEILAGPTTRSERDK